MRKHSTLKICSSHLLTARPRSRHSAQDRGCWHCITHLADSTTVMAAAMEAEQPGAMTEVQEQEEGGSVHISVLQVVQRCITDMRIAPSSWATRRSLRCHQRRPVPCHAMGAGSLTLPTAPPSGARRSRGRHQKAVGGRVGVTCNPWSTCCARLLCCSCREASAMRLNMPWRPHCLLDCVAATIQLMQWRMRPSVSCRQSRVSVRPRWRSCRLQVGRAESAAFFKLSYIINAPGGSLT